jgi:8-hydroxy-5-deazaflavin:NADPH oxidoreductase
VVSDPSTSALGRAQQLEQLGFLHISLQQPLGLGFGSAVKLVTP